MPMLMSLEGLSMRPIDRFKAKVTRAMEYPHYQMHGLGAVPPPPPMPIAPPTTFDLYVAPFKEHPIILLLGILGGMWYAARKK